MNGKIINIFIAPVSGGKLLNKNSILAIAGQGLQGDRYFNDHGEKSDNEKAVTLIQADANEICRQRLGKEFAPELFRRNFIVENIKLNELVGKEFIIGEAKFLGYELCHPCKYLTSLLGADMLRGLQMCGGLRAKIVKSGLVKNGDQIDICNANVQKQTGR